jgi:hypothetical protein
MPNQKLGGSAFFIQQGMAMRAIVRLVLCTTGLYIVLCVGGAGIKGIPAAAIELQREQQPERVIPPPRTPPRNLPPQIKPYIVTPKTVSPQRTPVEATVPDHNAPGLPAPQTNGPKFVVPNGSGMNSGGGGKMITAPDATKPNTGVSKTLQTFTPRGTNATVVTMSRVRSVPAMGVSRVSIGGQDYSMWRHSYRTRYHDRWYTCVALSALPAILIASNEFYPFAYIDAPESYCDGLSEDGCQLVWQDVETEEGGVIPQCVAYCSWQQ